MIFVATILKIFSPLMFYLVYYCHKGIIKSFEVICLNKTIGVGAEYPPLTGIRLKDILMVKGLNFNIGCRFMG